MVAMATSFAQQKAEVMKLLVKTVPVFISSLNKIQQYAVHLLTYCTRLFYTRGVQKVRRPTQLTTRYAHHILSLFNIDTCNWNPLGPAFLQRSNAVVEELLFLDFQPAICYAIRTRMANTVGDGVVQNRHFGWQPVLWLTCDQMRRPGYKWLLFFPKLKEFMKRHKIFWRRWRYLHDIWLAGRPRTTILLQRDQSFGEMLDQVHFSCRCLCWKLTKYDLRIL